MDYSDTQARSGTENSGRPSDSPVTGQQTIKERRLTRAERRAKRRAEMDAATLQEWAANEVPAGLSLENSGGPGADPVTGLLTSEDRRTQLKEEHKTIAGQGILPRGRPCEYTEEEGDTICAWIQAGGSLRSYGRQTGRKAETIYRWMRERADFQARLAHAREDQADTFAEEMLEIADAAATNPSIEGVAAAKLRVEARKWIASKLRPNKWGDKQTVEHVGGVNIRIGIPAKPTTPELVERVDSMAIPDASGPHSIATLRQLPAVTRT
jgi:hypothetical protein